MNEVKQFTDMKSFFRFVMNYKGELTVIWNKAYCNNEVVAEMIWSVNKEVQPCSS